MNKLTMASISVAAVLSGLAVAPQSSKPVRSETLNIDYARTPPTVEEAVGSAAAVIVGSIRESRNHPANGGKYIDRTLLTVDVSDVIASDGRVVAPSTIEVVRFGAETDKGDYIDRKEEAGFPKLSNGQEYVIFLGWNASTSEYMLWHGPEGAYQLAPDGSVVPSGRSLLARQQIGKAKGMFVADLKRAARARKR